MALTLDDIFTRSVQPYASAGESTKFSLTRNALEWWASKDFGLNELVVKSNPGRDTYIEGKIYESAIEASYESRPEDQPYFTYPALRWIVDKMHGQDKSQRNIISRDIQTIQNEVLTFFKMLLGGRDGKGGTAFLFFSKRPEEMERGDVLKRRTTPNILHEELFANFYILMRHVLLHEKVSEVKLASGSIAKSVLHSLNGHSNDEEKQRQIVEYNNALSSINDEDVARNANLIKVVKVETPPVKPEPEQIEKLRIELGRMKFDKDAATEEVNQLNADVNDIKNVLIDAIKEVAEKDANKPAMKILVGILSKQLELGLVIESRPNGRHTNIYPDPTAVYNINSSQFPLPNLYDSE